MKEGRQCAFVQVLLGKYVFFATAGRRQTRHKGRPKMRPLARALSTFLSNRQMDEGWMGDYLEWRVACLEGGSGGAGMGEGDTYSTAMHSAATCETFIFLVSECG